MPPPVDTHECIQEQRISKLEASLEYFIKRTGDHIYEGEKSGGHRDRLLLLEQAVDALKKAQWLRGIVSGLIGGFIARAAPDMLAELFKFIAKVFTK